MPADPPGAWELEAQAPAKLNLALEVVRRRPDGFHDIRSVFQAIELSDRLRFRRRGDGEVRLAVIGPEAVPDGPENLVHRAAMALAREVGQTVGADIELTKRIPAGTGLGGGSSDAAATLLALERLWRFPLSEARRAQLALDLGSDVPFFLMGGTALAEGRGERLTPLPAPPGFAWVIRVPRERVSTADAYQAIPAPVLTKESQQVTVLSRALSQHDARAFLENLENDLLVGVVRIQPRLTQCEHELRDGGALAVGLTGSGSAFFALFSTEGSAREYLERGFVQREPGGTFHPKGASGGLAFLSRPVAFGARVIPEGPRQG